MLKGKIPDKCFELIEPEQSIKIQNFFLNFFESAKILEEVIPDTYVFKCFRYGKAIMFGINRQEEEVISLDNYMYLMFECGFDGRIMNQNCVVVEKGNNRYLIPVDSTIFAVVQSAKKRLEAGCFFRIFDKREKEEKELVYLGSYVGIDAAVNIVKEKDGCTVKIDGISEFIFPVIFFLDRGKHVMFHSRNDFVLLDDSLGRFCTKNDAEKIGNHVNKNRVIQDLISRKNFWDRDSFSFNIYGAIWVKESMLLKMPRQMLLKNGAFFESEIKKIVCPILNERSSDV